MANEDRSITQRVRTPWRMSLAVFALITLPLAAATACSSASDQSTQPGPDMLTVTNLLGAWSMSGESVPAGPTSGLSVEFHDDHTFGFFDGCNQGGGRYAVSAGRVRFSETTSTAKGCLGTVWSLTDPPRFVLSDDGTVLTVGTSQGDVDLHRIPGS